MANVDVSERESFFEEHVRSLLFNHVGDFDCSEADRDGVSDSHKADSVLVLFDFRDSITASLCV